MANKDKFAEQLQNIANLLDALERNINGYHGSMSLVNTKRISKYDFENLMSYLNAFEYSLHKKHAELTELVQRIDLAVRNDINNNSSNKLNGPDKELLNLMRSFRDSIESIDSPLKKQLEAEKTIEDFYRDYHSGQVERKAQYLLTTVGHRGKKPTFEQLRNLSIVDNSPEEVMPYLAWLIQEEGMLLNSKTSGLNAEQSLYRSVGDRLTDELQYAPADVQAKYMAYITTYALGLRMEAKKHYDGYYKNPPQGMDPQYYALTKLAQDPVYWSCSNFNNIITYSSSTRLADMSIAFANRQNHFGAGFASNESYAFIGDLLSAGITAKLEEYWKLEKDYPKDRKQQREYLANRKVELDNPEKIASEKALKEDGYIMASPIGRISYAYGELLADSGKGSTLFNSFKYNFNQFAKLNHDDIGELSRKNYYEKLSRAQHAVDRYLAGFEGKTPKGDDVERFKLASDMKTALAEHKSNISKTAPLPAEKLNPEDAKKQLPFNTFSDIVKDIKDVDPGYIKSSKEFKAIKATVTEVDQYFKDIDTSKPLSPDQMEAAKEYCQLLILQAEAYIELKEDPIRSPKQSHLVQGSNAKSRYDFVVKMQSTIKQMEKAVLAQEKKYVEKINLVQVQEREKDVDLPITVAEYLDNIKPLLEEQIKDMDKIYEDGSMKGTEAYNKVAEQLGKQYNISGNSKAIDYAITMNDLRAWGLSYAKADINNVIGSQNPEFARNIPDLNLTVNIKEPNKLALTKLLTAEIIENRLTQDPNSLNSMDFKKYQDLKDLVSKFIDEKYSLPGTENRPVTKPMTADSLLKDFCTKDGAAERLKEFDSFVAEKHLKDPSMEKLQQPEKVL